MFVLEILSPIFFQNLKVINFDTQMTIKCVKMRIFSIFLRKCFELLFLYKKHKSSWVIIIFRYDPKMTFGGHNDPKMRIDLSKKSKN